jgi:2'-5' RNA ligase
VKRLFVAVDLDDRTRAEIAEVGSALRSSLASSHSGGRITWVHADRLHLTLEFLGEVDEGTEQRTGLALLEPLPVEAFNVLFSGLGCFPPRGSPRVLWLGIVEGLAELRSLHGEVRRRLGRSGEPAEAFTPHLTLARFRDRVSRSELREIAKTGARAGPCRIDRVTLYESCLSPKGPSYTGLAEGLLKPCTSAPSSS